MTCHDNGWDGLVIELICQRFLCRMKVTKETQRLLFLGKQLEDKDDDGNEFSLFDYNVKVRHLILLCDIDNGFLFLPGERSHPVVREKAALEDNIPELA